VSIQPLDPNKKPKSVNHAQDVTQNTAAA